jgi:hypothetical protein
VPGHSLDGPERGQRFGDPATRQLDLAADEADRQRRRGFGFGSDRALSALKPSLGLIQPPLPGQRVAKRQVSDTGGRLIGLAVLLCQVDRLPAELGCPRQRPGDLSRCMVGQGDELEIGPADPVRQRDYLFQVRLGLIELGSPHLGVGEDDQGLRTQLVA